MGLRPLPLSLTDLPAELKEHYAYDDAKRDTRTLYAGLLVFTVWCSFFIDSLYKQTHI